MYDARPGRSSRRWRASPPGPWDRREVCSAKVESRAQSIGPWRLLGLAADERPQLEAATARAVPTIRKRRAEDVGRQSSRGADVGRVCTSANGRRHFADGFSRARVDTTASLCMPSVAIRLAHGRYRGLARSAITDEGGICVPVKRQVVAFACTSNGTCAGARNAVTLRLWLQQVGGVEQRYFRSMARFARPVCRQRFGRQINLDDTMT